MLAPMTLVVLQLEWLYVPTLLFQLPRPTPVSLRSVTLPLVLTMSFLLTVMMELFAQSILAISLMDLASTPLTLVMMPTIVPLILAPTLPHHLMVVFTLLLTVSLPSVTLVLATSTLVVFTHQFLARLPMPPTIAQLPLVMRLLDASIPLVSVFLEPSRLIPLTGLILTPPSSTLKV